MQWRPRFEYDVGSSFETEHPSRPWTPMDETVGGSRTAASGVPASYLVRRDATVSLTLRLEETEWADFLALIAFGQTAQAFLWFPDTDEVENFSVYLAVPSAGERLTPTRDNAYPAVFEVTITLRSADGTAPWLAYFS